MRPSRDDSGAATAELAMALPLLLAVTVGLVWLLSVAAAQLRVVDAARESARAAARGDSTEEAVARGLEVAPPGSSITLTTGAQVDGRALARNGAVTLDTINVNADTCGGVICPAIALSPTTLPNGAVGVAYSLTMTASGGTAQSPITTLLRSWSACNKMATPSQIIGSEPRGG